MAKAKTEGGQPSAKWVLAKIGDIKRNPKNPRTIKDHKFKQLVKSIIEFPEMLRLRPIVVNAQMMVLGGNMRLSACIEAGLKEVPVIVADELTEAQQQEFIIKDNVSFGEWDWAAIGEGWGVEVVGKWGLEFHESEQEKKEATEDNFDVPEGGIETDIVLGDLFEIGRHRLLCGDSTKEETFARLFGDDRADMVLTDPPYNVAYEGGTKEKLKIMNDKQSDGDFYLFLLSFYKAQSSVTKKGGAWYVWQPDKQIHRFISAFESAGIRYSGLNVWVKNTLVMGRGDYHSKHETCIYGWIEGAAHKWYSDRKQTSVLNFDKPSRNGEHPTMKPVPLFAYQIGNSSKQEDIVADGFGGSGTTMVACHQMNRKGYLVEFDPKYCQVIINRMLALDPSLEIKKNGEPYGKGKD